MFFALILVLMGFILRTIGVWNDVVQKWLTLLVAGLFAAAVVTGNIGIRKSTADDQKNSH
jgi:uncharacterized membrane protein YiaA